MTTKTQPEEKDRAAPGSKGDGNFYRIQVRSSDQFAIFRTHDVGDPGGIERIAGRREDGSWDTQAWLISKDIADKKNDTLKALDDDAQELLDQLGSQPTHVKGDIYRAEPGGN